MAVTPKHKVEPEKPCPCESGLKFKDCHGDSAKLEICNRVANETMVQLIAQELFRQGLICKHGIKKGEKCIDCNSVQELEIE